MDKDYTEIDRFLEGNMTHEEQTDFEKCLKTNAVLAQDLEWVKVVQAGVERHQEQAVIRELLELTQVELEEAGELDEYQQQKSMTDQVVIEGIAQAERRHFREHLQNIASELSVEGKRQAAPAQQSGMLRRILPYTAVAATVLLLVLAGLFYFPSQSHFQAHFEPFENNLNQELELVLTEQGAAFDVQALKTLQKGLQNYQQQDYKQAISLFENYLNPSENTYKQTAVKLYLSNAYLATSQTAKAIDLLQTMGSYEAQWYLALAYLQQADIPKAKKLLQKLSEVADYQAKANKILESL